MSNPLQFVSDRIYHKSNFSDALKYVIPSMYFEEDNKLNTKEIDILDQVINSQLNVIGNISSILNISSIVNTTFSSLNTANGIAPFFVKQNSLTNIDSNDFERKILIPLDKSLIDFDTSADFSDYLNDTLLPGTVLNRPTLDFVAGAPSANHNYLITNLSWLYFLNTSGVSYAPSAYVHDLLIESIYQGKEVTIDKVMKGLTTYLWKNYTTFSPYEVIPEEFRPDTATDTYTSGTLQLEKLNTLIEVLYSPLYIDSDDFRVRDAIQDYIENDFTLTSKKSTGPFIKLVKALSFAFADYSNSVDKVEILNDLNKCPDELLPYLADLIGWRLFGSEPDRWRLQIANAVDVYRATGTKKSIQFAVDAILGQDVFNVSSQISELWESYIPFLIYYALATESTLLKTFSTWNRDTASNFNITSYSTSSMDENIRLCVDQIILDLVNLYRTNFLFNGKPFPLGSIDFEFNYRGRVFSIPPFEEYPYYLQTTITQDMIDSIADKLVCYGVPQAFALQVADYIRENIFERVDDIALKSGWLFFTSGSNYPPNWGSVIEDISNNRGVDYIPLWSGKSSHFKVMLEASSFDFNKTSLEADSRETIRIVGQAAKEFSPAHSIPDVIAKISDEDSYSLSNVNAMYLGYDKVDAHLLYSSGAGLSRYGSSALAMNTYKRGLNSEPVFGRGDTDSIIDPLLSASSTVAILPRRAHRRRNLKNLLNLDGFYSLDGENQPAPWDIYERVSGQDVTATIEQPVLYLGLIPSSLTWVPITDYVELPSIWRICENLNSSSVYSGLSVSNTFPIRGWRGIESNAKITELGTRPDWYVDMGQLDPFIATLHFINEEKKIQEASAYYTLNPSSYDNTSKWKNILGSHANSATEYSGAFPSYFSSYTDFRFGREFHKYYYDYCHNFNRHRVSPSILSYDGAVILAHSHGSVIYNSNFDKQLNRNLITSSLADTKLIDQSVTAGTFTTSGLLNIGVGTTQIHNSGVLDHIELVLVSGASDRNHYSVIDIDPSRKSSNRRNQLLDNEILIRQKSYDGFNRIIFDISKYILDSTFYDKQTNFLSPNHEFKFSIDSLIGDEDGKSIGGGAIGVWIHTKPEGNKIWSFVNSEWIQHSADSITLQQVLQYSNLFNFSQTDRDLTEKNKFKCIKFLDPNNPNKANDVIASYDASNFNPIEVTFNTNNKPILVPNTYFDGVSPQVHRLNQQYVIEVFSIPTQDNKFSLFYNLNMVDLTLNKWSKPFVTQVACQEFRVDLPKEKILTVLKYFNKINGAYSAVGFASRVASETQNYYELSGGSRINYVESPLWNTNTRNSLGLIEDLTINN